MMYVSHSIVLSSMILGSFYLVSTSVSEMNNLYLKAHFDNEFTDRYRISNFAKTCIIMNNVLLFSSGILLFSHTMKILSKY